MVLLDLSMRWGWDPRDGACQSGRGVGALAWGVGRWGEGKWLSSTPWEQFLTSLSNFVQITCPLWAC